MRTRLLCGRCQRQKLLFEQRLLPVTWQVDPGVNASWALAGQLTRGPWVPAALLWSCTALQPCCHSRHKELHHLCQAWKQELEDRHVPVRRACDFSVLALASCSFLYPQISSGAMNFTCSCLSASEPGAMAHSTPGTGCQDSDGMRSSTLTD